MCLWIFDCVLWGDLCVSVGKVVAIEKESETRSNWADVQFKAIDQDA